MRTPGLHHESAVAGNPRGDLDSDTGTPGLRQVRRTATVGDHSTHHLHPRRDTPPVARRRVSGPEDGQSTRSIDVRESGGGRFEIATAGARSTRDEGVAGRGASAEVSEA